MLARHEGVTKEINPDAGAVLVDTSALVTALQVLRDGPVAEFVWGPEYQLWEFSCLMQLVEALVLHEQIFFDIVGFFPFTFDGIGLEDCSHLFYMLTSATLEKHFSEKTIDLATSFAFRTDPGPFEWGFRTAAKYGLAHLPAPRPTTNERLTNIREPKSYYSAFVSQIMHLIRERASHEAEDMNRWLNEARFKIETPLIFNYVFQRKGWTNRNIIETTLEVRESKEAIAFRKVCCEFDQAARIGEDKTLYRLKREIETTIEKLNRRYQQPTLELSIEFPPAISLNPIELWHWFQHKRKRYLVFIQNIYEMAVQSKGLREAFYREYRPPGK